MAIKLLIADDDALIRESLKIIIDMDEDIEVVAVAENGLEAFKLCQSENIDVALLDVRMPVMNGVEATLEICSKTNTRVLILTTFDEDEYIKAALKNGAKGYILKNKTPEEIKDAIKIVNGKNVVIQDEILKVLTNSLEKEEILKLDKNLFTEREIDIMKAIAEGLSNKEISEKLFISEGTVKNYITNIFNKTNLKHRTQIAIYYLKGGKL